MPVKEVKYGYLYGPRCIIKAWPLAASQNFENDSGKWMDLDASNRLQIAAGGVTDIKGWALVGDVTSSATAGQDSVEIDICHFAVYSMPTNVDPADTLGETCDLLVTGGNQQARVNLSTDDILEILDVNTADDVVGVHLVSRNITYAGVV